MAERVPHRWKFDNCTIFVRAPRDTCDREGTTKSRKFGLNVSLKRVRLGLSCIFQFVDKFYSRRDSIRRFAKRPLPLSRGCTSERANPRAAFHLYTRRTQRIRQKSVDPTSKSAHPLRIFPKPVVNVWPLYNGNENSYAKTATVDPNKPHVAESVESLAPETGSCILESRLLSRALSWFAPRGEPLERERAGRIRERKLERILELGVRRNEIRLILIIAGPSRQLRSREDTRMDTRSGPPFVARRETRVRFANSSPRKKACIRRAAPFDGRTRAIVSDRNQ